MNLNLFRFELRLNRFPVLVLALSLVAVQVSLVFLYTVVEQDRMAGLLDIVPGPLRSIMDASFMDLLSVKGYLAFCFTPPLVLILLCSAALSISSRSAVGSVDDGLTDLILSQPVPRWFVILSRMAAGELLMLLIVFCMWAGQYIGTLLANLPSSPPRTPYIFIAVNAYAFTLAVKGLGFLIAVCSRRRANAVGVSIAVLAIMFFFTFCSNVWKPLKLFSGFSFFNYYVPGKVLFRGGTFPIWDVLALLSLYLLCAGAAVFIFQKRDM